MSIRDRETTAEPTATERAVLESLPLLASLSAELRELVVDAFEPVDYPFGSVIVHQGDPAEAMFVIAEGSVRVLASGEGGEEVPLNVLDAGAAFGELGLLDGGARSSTVRARTPVRLLRLDRGLFQAILRRNPQVHAEIERRRDRQVVHDFLRLRSPLGTLPVATLAALAERMATRSAPAGSRVLAEDGTPASLIVVREGRLSIQADGAGETALELRPGDLVGEAALLGNSSQRPAMLAMADSLLLELDADAGRALMAEHPALRELLDLRHSLAGQPAARLPEELTDELVPRTGEPAAAPAAPEPVPAVAGVRSARVWRGFPFVRQIDETDCGAACLAMICRHWGRRTTLTRIREAAGTSQQGTSLRGLARAGRALGLDANTVKSSPSRLAELPLPAIAHWEADHWVVLYRVDSNHVRYADPARGLRRLARSEAERKLTGYVVSYRPTDAFYAQPEQRSSLRWLRQFMPSHRRALAIAAMLALAAAGLQMLIPVIGQQIVDHAVPAHDRGRVNLLALALIGMLAVTAVVIAVQRWVLARTAARLDRSLLDFLTGQLLELPMTWFYSRRIGDIERRLNSVALIRQFLVADGVVAVTATAQLLAGLALMLVYNRVLTLVYLAMAPLYGALIWVSRRRLRRAYDAMEEAYGRYQSRQIDAIKGIETIKAMGREQALRGLIMRQFGQLRERIFRADLGAMLLDGAVTLVGFLSLTTFLWVGALQVLDRHLTLGALVAFEALVVLGNAALATLLVAWDQFQYTGVLLGRMNDIIEPEPEQGHDRTALAAVPAIVGEVSIRGVSFAFPSTPDRPILDDISVEVAAGTRVAIVGRSGAGKTTLLRLLAGLQQPSAGTILYDGVDMATLDWRELRRHIGFVVQDSYVFDDTVAANIAFGEPAPDRERVVAAAKAAAAHEFIERLPFGYETKVGGSGLQLSGGQAQRVAIARALYLRPRVVIFDEATSALDSESERAVQEHMDELLAGRTSLVVAHRLSTVRRAEVILVLEDGRIVERGTHDELLDRRGLYHYLAGQQLGL